MGFYVFLLCWQMECHCRDGKDVVYAGNARDVCHVGQREAQNERCANEEGDVTMHFVPIPQCRLCAEYNPTKTRA